MALSAISIPYCAACRVVEIMPRSFWRTLQKIPVVKRAAVIVVNFNKPRGKTIKGYSPHSENVIAVLNHNASAEFRDSHLSHSFHLDTV